MEAICMDTESYDCWKEFRRLAERIYSCLKKNRRFDHWIIECYDSVEKFESMLPTADVKNVIIEVLKEIEPDLANI